MKLEDQVCSLELAKKLKELRVKQDSLFCYLKGKNHFAGRTDISAHCKGTTYAHWTAIASAFTVAELGEMLPYTIKEEFDNVPEIVSFREPDMAWVVQYMDTNTDKVWRHPVRAKTEADARAKMLIHLIENKLIKVEDL